jgi:phospholipase C
MSGKIEKSYSKVLKYAFYVANPFKKKVLCTECEIHKFINFQALEILKNDNYNDASSFFSDNITSINEGVVWADQDFKSSGHFYNPYKEKGLFGSSNALSLALGYYGNSLAQWKNGDIYKSMFYLGATVHLVQDMTVPQHANIRLLGDHRQYENFIKRTYHFTPKFRTNKGGYYLEEIGEFIRCNARTAMMIYDRLKSIEDDKKRYYTITKFTLPLAQKTTAGSLMRFYRDAARTLKK